MSSLKKKKVEVFATLWKNMKTKQLSKSLQTELRIAL